MPEQCGTVAHVHRFVGRDDRREPPSRRRRATLMPSRRRSTRSASCWRRARAGRLLDGRGAAFTSDVLAHTTFVRAREEPRVPDLRGDDRVDPLGARGGPARPHSVRRGDRAPARLDGVPRFGRRTLSDPNAGGPCLDGDAALARFEIRLSDADLAMLDDCRRTACSTDEIITACAASVPALAVFADCLRSPEVADRSEVRGLGRGKRGS